MRVFITVLSILTLALYTLASTNSQAGDDRVSKYLLLMQSSLDTSTLLYSRHSPEVAKMIKNVAVPTDAKSLVECFVDKVKTHKLLPEFDEIIQLNSQLQTYIRETPTLTLISAQQDTEYMNLQSAISGTRFESVQQHSLDCGLIKMTQQLIRETGVFDAMKTILN